MAADNSQRKKKSPRTLEANEREMIILSMQQAKKELEAGKASGMVVLHYLKLGSTLAELEREKLANENELLRAKAKNLATADEREKMYQDVLAALVRYTGGVSDEPIDAEEL